MGRKNSAKPGSGARLVFLKFQNGIELNIRNLAIFLTGFNEVLMASLNLDQPTHEPSALGERPILLFVILALFFGAVGALFYFPAFQTSPRHRLTRVAVNSGRPVQGQFANSAITSDSLTKLGSSKPEATAGTIQNLPANEYGSQLKTLTQAASESKAAETTDILVSFLAAVPAPIAEADSKTIEAGPAQQPPESESISVRSPSTRDVREEKPAADDKADPGEGIANSQPPAKLAPDLEGKMMKRASVLMDQNDTSASRASLVGSFSISSPARPWAILIS